MAVLHFFSDYIFKPRQFWPYPRILMDAIVSGVSVTIALAVLLRAYGMELPTFFVENGVHENVQTAVLCTASIIAILAAVRLRAAGRFVAITTAFICLMFFVREIPSCHANMTSGCLPRGMHKIVAIAGGIVLLQQAISMIRLSPLAFFRMIHPAFSWPLALVATLLVMGELFEKIDVLVLEETFELLAYMILLFSSGWMLKSGFHADDRSFSNKAVSGLMEKLRPSADHYS